MKRFLFSLIGLCFIYGVAGAATSSTTHRTSGMVTNDTAKVHRGELYTASLVFESLANNGTGQFLLDLATNTFSDVTEEIHVVFATAGGGDAFVLIHDSPTITSSGTLVNGFNFNRTIATAPTLLVYHTPTIPQLTVGTTIHFTMMPGGTGGNANGGTAKATAEFVFKRGRFYTIAVINKSGGAKDFSIDLDWYEVVR